MPIYQSTRDMLDMLPRWMAMQQEDSNGAKFLDTVGRQLEDFESLVEAVLTSAIIAPGTNEKNPDKINILGIDYLYRFKPHSAVIDKNDIYLITTLNGVEYYPERAKTIYDFYVPGQNKYYLDTDSGIFYFKENYDAVIINGATYPNNPLELHHVWNPLDEIGLILGCKRLVNAKENNDDYRLRLLDVFRNPGNSSNPGLVSYIARSLGLEKESVQVDSLDNDDYVQTLINEDGSLKPELKEYMAISRSVNGFGMNTYWETLDEGAYGLKYLPMVWDLGFGEEWDDSRIQNGIGDTDDLEIIQPKQEDFEQNFKYNLYAEGLLYPDRKIYPEHRFKYKVYATGKKYDDGYAPEWYNYTITASELILLAFEVMANKTYEHIYRVDYENVNTDQKTTITQQAGVDIAANPNSYVTHNVKLTDGTYCTNAPRKYIQVLANMESDPKKLKTPVIRNITVNYKADGVDKKVKVETAGTVARVNTNEHIVGFESNTWEDASPYIRVKSDTNDMYNVIAQADNTLTLGHGDYQKVYDSEGDWDDGMSNPETKNVAITSGGTLKLGNMKVL